VSDYLLVHSAGSALHRHLVQVIGDKDAVTQHLIHETHSDRTKRQVGVLFSAVGGAVTEGAASEREVSLSC